MAITDLLYDGAAEYLKNELKISHRKEESLSYVELPNAYVLPFRPLEGEKNGGGIMTEDLVYLKSSGVHYDLQTFYDFDVKDVAGNSSCEETAVYLGMFYGVWGHCLTDNLRRMWFLKSQAFSEQFENCRLVYTTADGKPLGGNFVKLLEILGLDCSRMTRVDQVTQFRKLILPDESFFLDDSNLRYVTKEFEDTVSRIRAYGEALAGQEEYSRFSDYKKVFLTYSQYTRDRAFGEDILADYFSLFGYKIVAPEKYSLEEQLVIFANCESLASTSGSCSHGCIFLRDGAELILIPRSHYLTGYQEALNEIHGLNITYVDSSLSDMVQRSCPWGGPFCFCISDNLKAFMEKKDSSVRTEEREQARRTLECYFRYSEKCSAKFRRGEISCPDYYATAVEHEIEKNMDRAGYSKLNAAVRRSKYRVLYRTYYLLKRMRILKSD